MCSSSSSRISSEPLHRVDLEREVDLELLRQRLSDVDLGEALHIRDSLEEEHTLDELLGMHEVLVDRRQLGGQHVIEDVDDLLVALHGRGLWRSSLGDALRSGRFLRSQYDPAV